MTSTPKTIDQDEMAAAAVQVMEASAITCLAVTAGADGRLAGVLHLHHLLEGVSCRGGVSKKLSAAGFLILPLDKRGQAAFRACVGFVGAGLRARPHVFIAALCGRA